MFNQDVGPTSPPVLLHARVTLTSAQILALAASPVPLIPAPGAGNIITLFRFTATLNFNSVAYSSTAIGLFYGNNAGTTTAIMITPTTVGAAVSTTQNNRGDVTGATLASMVNTPVVVTAAASPTAGNSTMDVDVWYAISKA